MSGKQIGRAYLRGCGLTLGVAGVGLVMGLVLVGFAVFMAHGARIEDEFRVMAMVGVVQLLLTGGLIAAAIWWVRRRGRRLDRGFPSGSGKQVWASLRGWSGEVNGRHFNAWVARGPRLELYLESDVRTRAAVRRVGPVIQAFGRLLDSKTLPIESPAGLSDCEVLARDADWMRRLLRRPGVIRTVAELMKPSERVLPGVRFGPRSIGYIRQFVPLSEIDEARIGAWLDQLSVLADAVSTIGPSPEGLDPSRLETWARTSRRFPIHPSLIGIGCGLAGVAVILVVVLAIVAFLER